MKATAADAISAYLREIGRKGGKIGGKRRLDTMTPEARSLQALRAARARWGKSFSWDEWPAETRFEIRHPVDRSWFAGFILTSFTKHRLYFYKPQFDGGNRRARHMTLARFQEMVASNEIRKETGR